MVSATIYVFYAGVTNTFNTLLVVSIALVIIEGIALIANHWVCPLTTFAKRYTTDRSINFNIYLPKFVAKYSRSFFMVVFIVGMILVLINYMK